jgi:pimeloyl-ACP methyl ester carboxylesterase
MPDAVRRALPWLRLRRSRVYAVGGSMGGQETLLLLAKHPRLLAGARLDCNHTCRERLGEPFGRYLQRLARAEVGGDPARVAGAYAARSPIAYASAIARSCVPLQLWWSRADRIVVDPDRQSAHMLALLRRLNPAAPVEGIEGAWAHSAEMVARTRLPFALARLGLLPATFDGTWGLDGATYSPPPEPSCTRR